MVAALLGCSGCWGEGGRPMERDRRGGATLCQCGGEHGVVDCSRLGVA